MVHISSRVQSIAESQTLAIEKLAKDMKANGIGVISLAAGEPDFPTPSSIRQAAKKAIDAGFTKYTDSQGMLELRKAIAAKLRHDNNLNYTPSQILVSCGAKHSIFNACMALLEKGDEVIIPVPCWVSYSEMVKLADATPMLVKGRGMLATPDEIAKHISPSTSMIILNSPCNPTGAMMALEQIRQIKDLAVKHNITVLADEIYEKICYGKRHVSIASLGREIMDLAITVNGVSKSYSMTGWRIGFAAGPEEAIRAMSKLQSQMTSNSSGISQMAALEALKGDQASVGKMRQEFQARRDYVMGRIGQINGLKCKIPDGTFYAFPDISAIEGNSALFAERLLKEAMVAVVPGIAFGTEGHIRISYATSMENLKKAFDRIERFVQGY